tara:strand:+ start:1137 stop:2186 length:1050 start_codon:yes stop_codon:yes gene_type:complete
MSTYNRFATPRAYVDMIQYNLANGWRDLDDITTIQDDGSTAVTFDAGSEASMFDGRPANYAQIAHDTQSFYIQFNTGYSTDTLAESNYIAILNHNMHDANAVFTVEIDDASNMASATKVSTTGSHTKLINADANDTAGEIDPAQNGWTLITWSKKTSDNQYVRITFAHDTGTGQNFAEDLVIGSIQYGEYIDFPSIDMNITTSIDYEGVKLQRSLGGNLYSTMTSMGAPTWDSTNPFNTTATASEQTYTFKRRHGRVRHSMNMSHITDTTLWASAMQGVEASKFYDAETLHSNFYNKVMGQHLPFLFTIDSTSTEEGDYGMFRLDDSTFSAQQTLHRMWTVKMDLVEDW